MTNRKYEAARNKLISKAEKFANQEAGPKPRGSSKELDAWNIKWNRIYHNKMNELARNEGL